MKMANRPKCGDDVLYSIDNKFTMEQIKDT